MSEGHVRTDEAVETDDNTQVLTGRSGSGQTRRQVLGTLGSGVAAMGAVSGIAEGQEMPTVLMGNNYFDPVGLAVEPGTTVRFEIVDGSHSATAYEERIPSGTAPFDSGTISQGGFEYMFDTPGTYDYYCIPHKSMGMTGRIVVGEPGGPAEETPIPDGDVPASTEIVTKGRVSSDETDTSGKHHSGMMGSRPGMMDSGGHGWSMAIPAVFVTAGIGLAGGALYWRAGQQTSHSSPDDTAIVTLKEQYAQGKITEEEFEHRLAKLNNKE